MHPSRQQQNAWRQESTAWLARITAQHPEVARLLTHRTRKETPMCQALIYPDGVKGNGRGEKHGRAKLSNIEVASIRAQLEKGESYRAIAAAYGISQHYVGQIKNWTKRKQG